MHKLTILCKCMAYIRSLFLSQFIIYYNITDLSGFHLRLGTKQYILRTKCCKRPVLKVMTLKEFPTKGRNDQNEASGAENM